MMAAAEQSALCPPLRHVLRVRLGHLLQVVKQNPGSRSDSDNTLDP